MEFSQKIKTFLDKVLDIVFPSNFKCILCNRDLPQDDMIFCEECMKENIFNDGDRCITCDTQIKEGNIVCDHCKKEKRYFKKCVCPLNYEKLVRKAVLKFKSDNAKYLTKPFAKLIYQRLSEEKIDFDLIVPVPSHAKTIKKRGYNPAKLLADELAVLTHKPCIEVLTKTVLTENQKNLDYKHRQENLKDSITLAVDKSIIKNKKVLLVDDVITTCATINICASLFNSAKEVYACAVARNQLRD